MREARSRGGAISSTLQLLALLLLSALLPHATVSLSAGPCPSATVMIVALDSRGAQENMLLQSLQGQLTALATSGENCAADGGATLLYLVPSSSSHSSGEWIVMETMVELNSELSFDSSLLTAPLATILGSILPRAPAIDSFVLATIDGVNTDVSCAVSMASALRTSSGVPRRVALVADHSLVTLLTSLNLTQAFDCTPYADELTFIEYIMKQQLTFSGAHLSSMQPAPAALYLSDFSISLNILQLSSEAGYIYGLERLANASSSSRSSSALAPLVWGWPASIANMGEKNSVALASKAGASVIASDVSRDLSVLQFVTGMSGAKDSAQTIQRAAKIVREESVSHLRHRRSHRHRAATSPSVAAGDASPPSPLPVPAAQHTVAFVFTDGDNLQYAVNGLPDSEHWGSPLRGTFPVGWGLDPVAGLMAAPVIESWAAQATKNDSFLPWAAGYSYPSMMSPSGLAQWASGTVTAIGATSALLRSKGLPPLPPVFSFIDFNFTSTYASAALAYEEIQGIIYIPFDGFYAEDAGKVLWAPGASYPSGGSAVECKPLISVRQSLWVNYTTPQSVAAQLNALPTDPASPESYSLVLVHLWSEGMEAVQQTQALLQPHVRVVSAELLVQQMTQYARPQTC